MQARVKKILKWSALLFLAGVLFAGIVAYRLYNKPHRDVAAADAIRIRTDSLALQYETDEGGANKIYLDKVLLVKGEVENCSLNQDGNPVLELKGTGMSSVRCTLAGKANMSSFQKGTECSVKGICTGYLTDVVLVRCVLSN